jgi:hypothetical protein
MEFLPCARKVSEGGTMSVLAPQSSELCSPVPSVRNSVLFY